MRPRRPSAERSKIPGPTRSDRYSVADIDDPNLGGLMLIPPAPPAARRVLIGKTRTCGAAVGGTLAGYRPGTDVACVPAPRITPRRCTSTSSSRWYRRHRRDDGTVGR